MWKKVFYFVFSACFEWGFILRHCQRIPTGKSRWSTPHCFRLFFTHLSLSLRLPLLCLPILKHPNQYCSTLLLYFVFFKAPRAHTNTILLYINSLGVLKSYYRGHHNISTADTFYNQNLWVATFYKGERGLEKVGGLTRHHLPLVLKWAHCLFTNLYILFIVSLLHWEQTRQFGANKQMVKCVAATYGF